MLAGGSRSLHRLQAALHPAGRMAHALELVIKKSRSLPHRSIAAGVQVKYEKHDWFIPTSLRPFGSPLLTEGRGSATVVLSACLGCCGHRPVQAHANSGACASRNGVRVRHLRRLDRREDGAIHRQGRAVSAISSRRPPSCCSGNPIPMWITITGNCTPWRRSMAAGEISSLVSKHFRVACNLSWTIGSRGKLTDEAFLKASEWRQVWGYDAALYMPLFQFARLNRIPMIALNVERTPRRASRPKRMGGVSLPRSAKVFPTPLQPVRPISVSSLVSTS